MADIAEPTCPSLLQGPPTSYGDMDDPEDETVKLTLLAERLLALGLVPRHIKVGSIEVQLAAYEPPRSEDTNRQTPGSKPPRNYYELYGIGNRKDGDK